MKWTTPRVIEVSVGMEINMYACATRSTGSRNSLLAPPEGSSMVHHR